MSVGGVAPKAHVHPHPARPAAPSDDPTAVAQQRIGARLDVDGDGALTAQELSKIEKQGHGKNGRPQAALFAALETPAAPQTVAPEPAAATRFGKETLGALIDAQAIAEKIMGAVDADEDGAFTLDELKEALPGKSGHAPGRAAHAERAFDRVDADSDGKVTLAELTALFTPPVDEPEPEPTPVETAEGGENVTPEVIDPTKQEPSPSA